jgi:hypothetical protein
MSKNTTQDQSTDSVSIKTIDKSKYWTWSELAHLAGTQMDILTQ